MSVAWRRALSGTNTDDGYREMRKMADEMHIPLTMHVLESEDDDKYCREVRGGRTIPHLERLGFIGPDLSRCTVSAWKRRTLTSSNSMM